MNKKSKIQPKALETINQNPGNQESFVAYSDSTQTMPQNYDHQSYSNPIPQKGPSKPPQEHTNLGQDQNIRAQERKEKKKKKKTRSDLEHEKPKINMSCKALEQDLKLLQEQHEIVTSKLIAELKQQGIPEQQIELIVKIVNQSHKRTLDKITKNLKILPAIYSQEMVPVQISLTGQTRKLNDLTQENLQLANSRIKAQKSAPKNIKIFPKIPAGSDIILKDGSVMDHDLYIKKKAENPQIEKVQEAVRQLEEHLINSQKHFLDTVELHRITNKDLEEDLNAMRQSEKSVKKKSEFNR